MRAPTARREERAGEQRFTLHQNRCRRQPAAAGRMAGGAGAFRCPQLGAAELAPSSSTCVREFVALQEAIGLDVVTDGEIGRLNFQDSFGLAVCGYDAAPQTLQVTRAARRRRRRRSALGYSRSRTNRHRGLASAPGRARGSSSSDNVPLEEYKCVARAREEARQSVADRAGPHLPALRPCRTPRRSTRHGRVHGRRGRDRAADDPEAGRRRLPLRPHRRAGLHRLCRPAVARGDARRAAKTRRRISRAR